MQLPIFFFLYINELAHEFLYGNTKPVDAYAFDGAFSHEMKFQFFMEPLQSLREGCYFC